MFIVLLILQVFIAALLILFKYLNQEESLSDFSVSYAGNVISIALITLLSITTILFRFARPKYYFKKSKMSFTFGVVVIVLILLGGFSSYISFYVAGEKGIYNTSIDVIRAAFFTSAQIVLVTWLFYNIGNVLAVKERHLLSAFLYSLIATGVFFGFSYFYALGGQSISKEPQVGEYDLVVVLGAAVVDQKPGNLLEGRLQKALTVHKDSLVGLIQVTGSNAPGEITEAEASQQFLMSNGVDSTKILIETKSTSTAEQIRFIKYSLATQFQVERILIISDGFHLVRIKEISDFYNLHCSVLASGTPISQRSEYYNRIRETISLMMFWSFGLK